MRFMEGEGGRGVFLSRYGHAEDLERKGDYGAMWLREGKGREGISYRKVMWIFTFLCSPFLFFSSPLSLYVVIL